MRRLNNFRIMIRDGECLTLHISRNKTITEVFFGIEETIEATNDEKISPIRTLNMGEDLTLMQAMIDVLQGMGGKCKSKDALYKATKKKVETEGGKAADKKLREALEKLEKKGNVEYGKGPHRSSPVRFVKPL